jgi:hypothetical protein
VGAARYRWRAPVRRGSRHRATDDAPEARRHASKFAIS